MKKLLTILLPILAVIVVGIFLFKPANKKSGDVKYRMGAVSRGELVRLVNATGTLEAVTTVQVGSQVSGTISAIYVDFNDVVHKSQPLALLDTTFLSAQVAEAQANLMRATATQNEAKRNFLRAESLKVSRVISSAEHDQSLTSYETSQAGVEAAKAALLRAKTNLAYARISSPISGTVISRNIDVGQTVAASLSAPTLFTIAQDLSKMRLLAAVDEADIGQLSSGNPVTFTVDAFPDRVFHGSVEQIRLAPVVSQNVVTYTVVIGVDNQSGKLMPGMTATVSIEVIHKDDVLKIPAGATRFRPASENGVPNKAPMQKRGGHKPDGMGNAARVYVLDGKKLVQKTIRIGLSTPSEIELLEGLQAGDSVIVSAISNNGEGGPGGGANPFNPMSGRGGGGRRM